MSICHVCLGSMTVEGGLVSKHRDSKGRRCPMSEQPPYVWDEIGTRETVPGRSGGICEICARRPATDMHHRVPRSLGGKWTPANILHVCRECHTWITDDPQGQQVAVKNGLSLRSHDNPERIPVQRLTGETLFLSDQLLPPRKAGTRRPRRKR